MVAARHDPLYTQPGVWQVPLSLGRVHVAGRAVMDQRTVHVADLERTPDDDFP